MITKIISYQTKPGAADRNAELSADVFREAKAAGLAGVGYLVLRTADDTFYHLVSYEDEAANERLTTLPAFERFAENGAERRIAPPAVTEVTVVGNYRILPE
jgi:hypothetical protein